MSLRHVSVVGIGAGDPDQITVQAIETLGRTDVVFIPSKGAAKVDLSRARQAVCERFMRDRTYRMVDYDVPARADSGDYRTAVDAWHAQIAVVFTRLLRDELGESERGAFLVWGDPAIYDSTIRVLHRIAAAGEIDLVFDVVPGISSLQILAAKHLIPLSEIAGSVLITTGRRLADGVPAGVDSVVVMLDRGDALRMVDPAFEVFWGGGLGTPEERLIAGRVGEVRDAIARVRKDIREANGWVMDTFLLRRRSEQR